MRCLADLTLFTGHRCCWRARGGFTLGDAVNPSHYKDGWSDGAELISITENLNFNRGNAVKYIARAGKKNPDAEVEDLEKALWYLSRELKRVKAKAGIETVTVPIREYARGGPVKGDFKLTASPQCNYTISDSRYGYAPDRRLLELINGAAFGRDGKIVQ